MSLVFSFLASIGRGTLHILEEVGNLTFFIISTIRNLFKRPFYFKEFLRAVVSIGFFSLPVIGLTALFTGGALALQIYSGGSRFNSESAVPAIVSIGMVRELGPVLCGLMIAGRVGSAIAAEIGTMKVSDQLDALVTLSTNPNQYLVIPRVAAATLVLPVLTGVGDILGIMGGFLVGTLKLSFSSHMYLNQAVQFLETADVVSGLVKGAFFGFIVATMGCYCGFKSGMGARGVGKATTQAVALSSILIIASNFVLTEIFF